MPPDNTDDDVIRFWMLEEVKSLPAGTPGYSDAKYVQNPDTLFLFADYSFWAHAYAIRLGKNPLKANGVVIIGYEAPKIVSNSFSEFVRTYLTARDRIY